MNGSQKKDLNRCFSKEDKLKANLKRFNITNL